ncbi:hypothetical protein PoMZ_09122, partial [Pyricularia oryzae]
HACARHVSNSKPGTWPLDNTARSRENTGDGGYKWWKAVRLRRKWSTKQL